MEHLRALATSDDIMVGMSANSNSIDAPAILVKTMEKILDGIKYVTAGRMNPHEENN